MSEREVIDCPKCGFHIDVTAIQTRQIEEKLHREFMAKTEASVLEYESKKTKLDEQQKAFELRRMGMEEEITAKTLSAIEAEKEKMKQKLKKETEEENAAANKLIQEELNQKSEQIKQLKKVEVENAKIRREKAELTEVIRTEEEAKYAATLQEEREKIEIRVEEKSELKIQELRVQLEQQKVMTEQMKRKQEQGSMQLQGEAQELVIESWLADQFPIDDIEEIKKGKRGADVLQRVHTRQSQDCGVILYESKRTKDFNQDWIPKFKEDMQLVKADIGVIVTQTMPKELDRMSFSEGVWICSFADFKALSGVLRESIITWHSKVAVQENKGDKMNLLYEFLTSNEFRLRIETIIETYRDMQSDLTREQAAAERHFSARKKQLEKLTKNMSGMYGEIKGIAGSAIDDVPDLVSIQPQGLEVLDRSS